MNIKQIMLVMLFANVHLFQAADSLQMVTVPLGQLLGLTPDNFDNKKIEEFKRLIVIPFHSDKTSQYDITPEEKDALEEFSKRANSFAYNIKKYEITPGIKQAQFGNYFQLPTIALNFINLLKRGKPIPKRKVTTHLDTKLFDNNNMKMRFFNVQELDPNTHKWPIPMKQATFAAIFNPGMPEFLTTKDTIEAGIKRLVELLTQKKIQELTGQVPSEEQIRLLHFLQDEITALKKHKLFDPKTIHPLNNPSYKIIVPAYVVDDLTQAQAAPAPAPAPKPQPEVEPEGDDEDNQDQYDANEECPRCHKIDLWCTCPAESAAAAADDDQELSQARAAHANDDNNGLGLHYREALELLGLLLDGAYSLDDIIGSFGNNHIQHNLFMHLLNEHNRNNQRNRIEHRMQRRIR